MKKFGFTLSEVLISMVIIGILSGAIIGTFKKNDKGIKYLYSNTYYVLDRALYNAITYWVSGDAAAREPFKRKIKYKDDKGKDVEATIDDSEGARRLCRSLVEYINPTEAADRDSICKVTDVDASGDDTLFTAENLQFTATNGVRYWISKRYPETPKEGEPDNDNDLKFYIIYADLNGPKVPNSMTYEKASESNGWQTKDPDIFAFAALENGRICPIGVPEVDSRYLTTRIVYEELDNDEQIELRYSSPSRPYVYSKAQSWGYYLPEAPKGETVVNDTDTISDEPFSFNGYVQSKILESHQESKIYDFLKTDDGTRLTMTQYVQNDPYNKDKDGKFNIKFQSDPPRYENNDRTKPNIGGYSCNWMSDEECYVLVDKYVY